MLSFKPVVLFLAAFSVAAPTGDSIFDKVMQDIDDIDSGVKTLIQQINAYEPGTQNVKEPVETMAEIYKALATGVVHSALLPPLSSDQANKLIAHVNSTLTVDNPIAVDAAIAKIPAFKESGVYVLFAPALGLLEAGHEAFTVNVGLKTPPLLIPKGLSVTSPISFALLKGIAAFSGLPVPTKQSS